jgi:ribonuclease HI
MLEGLRRAFEIDPGASVHVLMDSKLVVEQMSGRWKIKHPDMQQIAREARELIGHRPVTFEWVPRLQNSRADALANRSMDMRSSFGL